MIRSVSTAFKTLTVIPFPGNLKENFSGSLLFFPLTGVVLGLVPVLCYIASARYPAGKSIFVFIALGVVTLLTGCIHVDGIADCADAFGGAENKERVLEILKDPRHGTFGVVAVFLDLGIKALLWNELFCAGQIGVIIASLVFSRSMQAVTLAFMANARPGGLAEMFGKAPYKRVSAVSGFIFCCAGVFYYNYSDIMAGLALTMAAIAAMLLSNLYFKRRINGITGDCIGAVNETSEIAVLMAGVFI